MRTLATVGLVISATLLIAAAAQAANDDAPYAKLKAFLPPATGAQACYARTYDAQHLSQHPKQRVTEMVLFLRYITLSEEEATLVATEDGGIEKEYFRYDFTLAAKVRDKRETLHAAGSCNSAQTIGCGVDCDGGGIELEPVAGAPDKLLVRLERIRMTLGCGEDSDDIDLEGGEDDKVFWLDKIPVALCQAMQEKLGG